MGRRVFIVDDQPEVLEPFAEMISCLDCEVRAFSSAAACLARLQDEIPDVALFDVMMPEMNGIELVRRVRAAGHKFPIYLVTGYTDLVNYREAEQLGVLAIISKPVTFDQLEELICGAQTVWLDHARF